MADKRDMGLELHRWTQYIITAATLVLVYMARDIYEDVKVIRVDTTTTKEVLIQHEKRIDKIEANLYTLHDK